MPSRRATLSPPVRAAYDHSRGVKRSAGRRALHTDGWRRPLVIAPETNDAIAELNEQLAQPLLRYLQRYVGDRATAEDLLQETLLRATRGLEGFRSEERRVGKEW